MGGVAGGGVGGGGVGGGGVGGGGVGGGGVGGGGGGGVAGGAGGGADRRGPAGVDAFLADLSRWASDRRAEDAAGARSAERWLRQQAVEEGRFAGVALDLAEHGVAVAVRTTTGRTLHGRIVAVARDFCVVQAHGGPPTFVALAAVATVRPEPGHRRADPASVRPAPVQAGLVDVLAGMAPERPRVRVVVDGGGEAVAGELRSVGADVATVRLDGEPAGTVYLQLGSVREVTLLG